MRKGEATSAEGVTPVWSWCAGCCLAILMLLTLGAVEGWYGRTDTGDLFGSDGVQYLDCARAIGRGDLRSALNPLWSQGYPALLAMARPLFPVGMAGDWMVTRGVNLLIFCFCMGAFAYLLAGIARGRRDGTFWLCGAGVFFSAEVCLGQVSRVGPDELVAGIFFLACGQFLRLVRRPGMGLGAALGLVLGLGFLAKAVFLPMGCIFVVLLGWGLRRAGRLRVLVPVVVVFGVIVAGYGTMLSRAVGHWTLGESGSLNYAWHVNRLAKWVHWEGGMQSAARAWPSARIARVAQWESMPPEFGTPLHPSARVGQAPTVYVFHEPDVSATYVPYYDPAYWYEGYRHVFRWRFQAIALVKSLIDLGASLIRLPMMYAVLLALWMLRGVRRGGRLWLVTLAAGLGVALYLPVHLEARYLSGFLAVLAMAGLAAVLDAPPRTRHRVLAVILVCTALQTVVTQRMTWSRAMHGWSFRDNVEWKTASAVMASGLPRGTEVGMISWTANLHCDWAYLAGIRITSEIADGNDENAFWALGPAGQVEVLGRFRAAGAKAVLSWEGPPSGKEEGWSRLAGTPMWMYRF